MLWNIKFTKQRESKLIEKYVQNVLHWHKHNHASMLAIGQLHSSVSKIQAVPHNAEMVIYLSLCDSNVMFTSQVK